MATMKVQVNLADLNEVFRLIDSVGNNISCMPQEVRDAFDGFIHGRAKMLDEYSSAVLYQDLVEKFRKM